MAENLSHLFTRQPALHEALEVARAGVPVRHRLWWGHG
jgi:hypothetical protein